MAWSSGVAQADYQQVPEHFGESGEAAQLEEAVGMAVNGSGVGGVPAGSLYVVGLNSRVVRFLPGEEGEAPRFEEAWGWGVGSEEEGAPESGYQRCGPALSTEPAQSTYHRCRPANPRGSLGGEEVGHFSYLSGVAVDQATGDVYVRNFFEVGGIKRKRHLIEVFTATGTPVGEGFGDAGAESTPPESIESGPGKLHLAAVTEGGIAVDEAGTVYLNDADYLGVEPRQARVMSFAPCTFGNYENYCYNGRASDIAIPGKQLSRIALIGSGRLVGASEKGVGEYALAGGAQICSLPVGGQLQGMAANPVTGEVFYSTFADRSIHRLGPCDAETKGFNAIQTLNPTPEGRKTFALAVSPGHAWGLSRPAGVLYAVNAGNLGVVKNVTGYVFAPAEAFPPVIESESVTNTTTTSTTLEARIDPRGTSSQYFFQYLPDATYRSLLATVEGEGKSPEEAEDAAFAAGAVSPATPGGLASGAVGVATGPLSGLLPDTAYVFRVVASSRCNPEEPEEACEAQGAPTSFSTYPTSPTGLPDGRVDELVSPAKKYGGEVFPADPAVNSCEYECKPAGTSNPSIFPMQAAPGGEAVTYEGYPFSPTEGAAVYNSYLSRRTAGGWQTTAMSPALLKTKVGLDLSYGSALDAGAVYQPSPSLAGAPEGYANIYAQSAAEPGALTPLIGSAPPHRSPGGLTLEYAGATPDASRQYFAANDALIDEVPGIGVLPDPTSGGSNPNGRDLYEWRSGQLSLINILPDGATVAVNPSFASASPDAHAVAAGGRRVFWQSAGHLYVREDGQITREISHPGTFLAASENGLRVLLSDGCLYSLLTEACADLTQGHSGFLGVLGASEDLSKVYFVDKAALAGAPEAGSCTSPSATSEKVAYEEEREGKVPPGHGCNLYLYEAGAGTRFLAALGASDGNGQDRGFQGLEDWAISPGKRTAEASPSGRFLAFGSQMRLSGYDNVGLCEKIPAQAGYVLADAPCREAFLYDSATGRLSCASCNPTGEVPRGVSTLRRIGGAPAWLPQPRYVTDSGRLFFDSQDRLSPRDSNGKVEDVYEYEPQGLGSCERAGDCVALISPGTGSVDSNFLSMSETGSDVFFTTRERLVPTDTDELIDVYDARVGGGFPSETETQRVECQGESCQPVSQAPNDPTPSSSAFAGPGNVKEASKKSAGCPKGKVKKSGKCVKKKNSKKHGKHTKKNQKQTAKRTNRADRDRRTQR